jgi:hypothetical protein
MFLVLNPHDRTKKTLTPSHFRDNYGQANTPDPVSIKFSSGDVFYFPEADLVPHFHYFAGALRIRGQGLQFKECHTRHFDLQLVSAGDFAIILRWIMNQLEIGGWTCQKRGGTFKGCENLNHLLRAQIAADYLQLVELENFVAWHIRDMVTIALLRDRCKLKPAHIRLVQAHPAFRRLMTPWASYCSYIETFCQAMVRPLLEDRNGTYGDTNNPDPSALRINLVSESREEWRAIVRHCQDLCDSNVAFAQHVVLCVADHLDKAKEGLLSCYLQPLYCPDDPLVWKVYYSEARFTIDARFEAGFRYRWIYLGDTGRSIFTLSPVGLVDDDGCHVCPAGRYEYPTGGYDEEYSWHERGGLGIWATEAVGWV